MVNGLQWWLMVTYCRDLDEFWTFIQVKRLFKITELKSNSFLFINPKHFLKCSVFSRKAMNGSIKGTQSFVLLRTFLRVCSPFWKITLAMSAPLMEFSSPLQQTCMGPHRSLLQTQWFQVLDAYSAVIHFFYCTPAEHLHSWKTCFFIVNYFIFNSLCFSQFRQFRQFSQFRLINMRNWFLTILEAGNPGIEG